MIRRLLLVLGLTFAALPAAAVDLSSMTDAERDAFRAEIRAYLLENPEVLMEAIAVLDQRKAAEAAQADISLVAANESYLFDDGYSYVGGNPDGDITVVEFLDYRCTYCRRAHDEVASLIQTDGNIRFVIKEFPILGEQSLLSAQFAVAVQRLYDPQTYFDVHEALMTLKTDATSDTLSELATTFGLDAGAIATEMQSADVARIIAQNHALAQQMRITGTPTFVIGDRMLRGYAPLANMQAMVADYRTR